MTFNIEPPANPTGDQGQPNQQPNTTDNVGSGADKGITAEQLQEILKRDEHAQKHIQNLEAENESMRTNFSDLQDQLEKLQNQLNSRETLEQLLSRKETSTNINNPTEDSNNMNTPTSSVGLPDIDSLVNERIQGYMKEQEKEKNLSKVKTDLNNLFKDKADDHVKEVAAKNGISFDDAMNMAKTNPTLFNNVFVSPYNKASHSPAPTFGSQSTSSVPTQQQGITMDHWNQMRRENPRKFFSADTQKQFHQWFHSNKN